MRTEELKTNYKLLRHIIEQNFPLNELVPEYNGLTQNSANVFCVFHQNFSSPAAKLYWNDERDILVLHCFAEHKTFTSYDYVYQILCEEKGQYTDPLDFLMKNMSSDELKEALKLAEMNFEEVEGTMLDRKLNWISNLYNELNDTNEFINQLYTA